MNIAIISYYFNDHHAEGIVTAKLARGLSEAGHTVTVFGNLIGNQKVVDKNLVNLNYLKIDSNYSQLVEIFEKNSSSNCTA